MHFPTKTGHEFMIDCVAVTDGAFIVLTIEILHSCWHNFMDPFRCAHKECRDHLLGSGMNGD